MGGVSLEVPPSRSWVRSWGAVMGGVSLEVPSSRSEEFRRLGVSATVRESREVQLRSIVTTRLGVSATVPESATAKRRNIQKGLLCGTCDRYLNKDYRHQRRLALESLCETLTRARNIQKFVFLFPQKLWETPPHGKLSLTTCLCSNIEARR